MHVYDPNGTYRQYKRKKERDELVRACVFSGLTVLAMLGVVWALVYLRHQ